jgi:hypothetical protein
MGRNHRPRARDLPPEPPPAPPVAQAQKSKIIDAITLIAALVAAAASAVAAIFGGLQADAARQANIISQKNLATQNRPWVSLTSPIVILKPLIFDEHGASLEIKLPVKNGGSSPAKEVAVFANLVVGSLFADGPVPSAATIQAVFSLPCDASSVRSLRTGVLLLPGETTPEEISSPKLSKARSAFRPSTSRVGTDAYVGLCIAYKDQFDEPHATFVIYQYFGEDRPFFESKGVVNGTLRYYALSSLAF